MSFITQISGILPCIVSSCELDTFASLLPESYFENSINFELVGVNTGIMKKWLYIHCSVTLLFVYIIFLLYLSLYQNTEFAQ